jgi:transaldolase/glucose-6-phosphate isomerase
VVITMDEAAGPELAELAELADLASALEGMGHPVTRIGLSDPIELGGEFLRWEVAIAAAGMVLGIDPFDQPNVQESKDATRELLDAFRRDGSLPSAEPLTSAGGLGAYSESPELKSARDPAAALSALLATVRADDYVALLAYLPRTSATSERLQRLRQRIGARTAVATTLGFGPRFLHSTGQLHKGGPDSGVFLQLTAEPERDLPIPGWNETFGTLIAAQALGDLRSLQSRRRRALRLHGDDLETLLSRLEEMVPGAVEAGIGS